MAVQTAVVAWGAVRATGMPEGTWAVISALFVVQHNIGGTGRERWSARQGSRDRIWWRQRRSASIGPAQRKAGR